MHPSLTVGWVMVGPLHGHRDRQILHLFDYYIWGHMKTLVYKTKVDSRAELRTRIFAVAEQIRNHPDRIASAVQSLLMLKNA